MEFGAWFSSLPVDQIASGALVTLTVLLLLSGKLVPRSVMDARLADKDQSLAAVTKDRDDWKDAYYTSEAARIASAQQVDKLVDGAEATNRLLESMRNYLERGGAVSQRQIGE